VTNVAPTVNAGSDIADVNQGRTFSRIGTFTDAGADTWTATVDHDTSDANPAVPLTLAGKTFQLSHAYANPGTYMVRVTVHDGAAESFDDFTVTVSANDSPVVENQIADLTVPQGVSFRSNYADLDRGLWRSGQS